MQHQQTNANLITWAFNFNNLMPHNTFLNAGITGLSQKTYCISLNGFSYLQQIGVQ